MQGWDISVLNQESKTRVVVGRDMNDPDLTGVDSVGLVCRASLQPDGALGGTGVGLRSVTMASVPARLSLELLS
ncbi:MAG: hypothetical protein U0166_10825 [Acidobacteriota bacterium]